MPGIDHLAHEPLRSESVHLDVISNDAASAAILRLCRYPTQGAAWLWVSLFHEGEAWAHYDHTVACDPTEIQQDASPATYTASDATLAQFHRVGAHDTPTAAFAEATVEVSPGLEVSLSSSGSHRARVRLDFAPLHGAHTTFRGRSEVVGRVTAQINLDGRAWRIEGMGHWHEQHQTAPRFLAGFRYITLRGERLSTISVLTRRLGTGFVVRDGEVRTVTGIEIDPRGDRRRLRLTIEGGDVVEGELERRYDYSVPIYDGRRPGSLVYGHLDGAPVSGQINDWPGLSAVRDGAVDFDVTSARAPSAR